MPHPIALKVAWSEDSRAGGGVPELGGGVPELGAESQSGKQTVRMWRVSATTLIPLLVFLLFHVLHVKNAGW